MKEETQPETMPHDRGERDPRWSTPVCGGEYQIALDMANESARIRLHLLNGTDNVWHLRCYPVDAFLTEFDLGELREVLGLILKTSDKIQCPNCKIGQSCENCGTRLVWIRGQYPGTDRRTVCPQCTQEKLDDLHLRTGSNIAKEVKL